MQRDNQFLVLRFGWLFMAGLISIFFLVSEGLFRRPCRPECYCAVNNAHVILPEDSYRWLIVAWLVCIFCFHLYFLSQNRKRLGYLVRKARQIRGVSRSASVWSAVVLVFIIRTTNVCYGVWTAGCFSFIVVGLVNMISAEEDALATTRWVLHQSFVSAVLVAVLSQTMWTLYVVYALVPAVAALLVILAHKYIPLPGGPADENEFLLLPVSASDIFSSSEKERSCYVPIPELDTADMAMTTAVGPTSPSSELSHLAAPLLSDNMKQPHAG